MDSMRQKEFQVPLTRPKRVIDSRFGLRKFFVNDKVKPSVGTYNTAGRGPNGEHQS